MRAEDAVDVGLKRDVEAVLRREGKMERRTEGGGMFVGGGPLGEVLPAGFVVCEASLLAPQSSQSQSELIGAAFVEDVFSGPLVAGLVTAGLGAGGRTAGLGAMSSKVPHSASKLFFSVVALGLLLSSKEGHAVTGDGDLGSVSFGNPSLTGVFRPSPGKGFLSWNDGDFGG